MAQLDPNSTDVVLPGILHHYENRPQELEHLCLAKFTAWYNYYGKKPGKNQKEGHESDGNIHIEYPVPANKIGNKCS